MPQYSKSTFNTGKQLKDIINIGICGLGTVGSGVVELLDKNKEIITKRVGAELKVKRAATIAPYDNIKDLLKDAVVTDSVDDLINDPDIDVIVELIGGKTLAKDIVIKAFEKGKSVVTANKALLAECGEEVFTSAYQAEGLFGFEAAVAGGIPILRSIKEGFAGDEIQEVSGIINGTGNYILSSMTYDKKDFETALQDAKEKGYAEADPTFDIEGIDTAHKVAVLLNLSFNGLFDYNQIYVEGITGIEKIDIEIADEMGYTIKLLGKAVKKEAGFEGRVHPTLIKKDNVLASVNGAFNAVLVKGNFVGPTMSYGAGAGSHPTASAVVADIVDIGRKVSSKTGFRIAPLSYSLDNLEKKTLISMDEVETEYYLRFSVQDKAGVLAEITRYLGENNISIEAMVQKSREEDNSTPVDVVILTHRAIEKNIRKALAKIDSLPMVLNPTKIIRIDA